jgi:hypothetical protein
LFVTLGNQRLPVMALFGLYAMSDFSP